MTTPSPAAREAAKKCWDFLVNDYCDHLDEEALNKMQAIIEQCLAAEREAAGRMARELELIASMCTGMLIGEKHWRSIDAVSAVAAWRGAGK